MVLISEKNVCGLDWHLQQHPKIIFRLFLNFLSFTETVSILVGMCITKKHCRAKKSFDKKKVSFSEEYSSLIFQNCIIYIIMLSSKSIYKCMVFINNNRLILKILVYSSNHLLQSFWFVNLYLNAVSGSSWRSLFIYQRLLWDS